MCRRLRTRPRLRPIWQLLFRRGLGSATLGLRFRAGASALEQDIQDSKKTCHGNPGKHIGDQDEKMSDFRDGQSSRIVSRGV